VKDIHHLKRETALENEVKRLKEENASIEAKYLKKLNAAEVKKNNLAKYRRKMKELRKKTIARVLNLIRWGNR